MFPGLNSLRWYAKVGIFLFCRSKTQDWETVSPQDYQTGFHHIHPSWQAVGKPPQQSSSGRSAHICKLLYLAVWLVPCWRYQICLSDFNPSLFLLCVGNAYYTHGLYSCECSQDQTWETPDPKLKWFIHLPDITLFCRSLLISSSQLQTMWALELGVISFHLTSSVILLYFA